LAVVLPLALQVRAFDHPSLVPNLLGEWDGFYLNPISGDVDSMISVINRQEDRHFVARAIFLALDNRTVFNTINFAGTVAEDGFIHGKGMAPTGQLGFRGVFASTDGGAAVIAPEFHFKHIRGSTARTDAILLHPFDTHNPTNISGMGAGTFRSQHKKELKGNVVGLTILPHGDGNTLFPGELGFQTGNMLQGFRVLATTSDDSRIVMIAQGTTGRLFAEGTVTPPGTAGGATKVNALYRFIINERPADFGAINFTVLSSGLQ
jgi:hypothetical protein